MRVYKLINNGYSCLWEPDDDTLQRARKYAEGLLKESSK